VYDLDDVVPSRVEGILLDVGGVFLLPSPQRVRAALRDAGLDTSDDDEPYRRAHFHGAHGYDHSDDQPETWPRYHVAYAEALGYEGAELQAAVGALVTVWDARSNEHWSWRQEGEIAALARLAALDLPLGIVSNSDGTIEQALVQHDVCQLGDGPAVDVAVIVDSAVLGAEKPDPAAFRPALDVLDVEPDRVVFVGDTVRNDVDGARAAGLRPVQLDPYDLHPEAAHPRVRSLVQLADHLTRT
jgi:putative hydrolase of the HAD superfamily